MSPKCDVNIDYLSESAAHGRYNLRCNVRKVLFEICEVFCTHLFYSLRASALSNYDAFTKCRLNVYNPGPALNQHWVNVLCSRVINSLRSKRFISAANFDLLGVARRCLLLIQAKYDKASMILYLLILTQFCFLVTSSILHSIFSFN